MEGRWKVYWDDEYGMLAEGPLVDERVDEPVPVVPCDDAAVERAARAISAAMAADPFLVATPYMPCERLAREALRAAGETT